MNQDIKKKKNWIIPALGTIIIVLITSMFLLGGSTTTTKNEQPTEKSDSISCEVSNLSYPIFTYNDSTRQETRINAIYNNDRMQSISLIHTMYYDNARSITTSEAKNHAAMGLSYSSDGLRADAYNTLYTKLSDSMRMTLYASGQDINSVAAKYFMISSDPTTTTLEELQNNYIKQGFDCKIVN